MGEADLGSLAGENIVALCDVDENTLGNAASRFPKAKKYFDFRQMLENEERQIDAVQVSTPDHIHAPASVMAMKMGKHCFCQKPLAHDVTEARIMARLAAEKKLATQMGTQIHATENYRRVVEIIQAGAIGPVREAVVWCGKDWGGGKHRKAAAPPSTCTGTCGWARPPSGPTNRACTIRKNGAAGGTSAPARWATWLAT